MRDVTNQNFGYLISYILPGFVALWGVSHISPTVAGWLGTQSSEGPTVGGFLYVTIGSVGAGLTISTIRWALLDAIHHRTGIPLPPQDFSKLQDKLTAYQYLVGTHYDYYKFHSNMAVSLAMTFVILVFAEGWSSIRLLPFFIGIEIVFWFGSRDTLRKYHAQGRMLLGEPDVPKSPFTKSGKSEIEGPLREAYTE